MLSHELDRQPYSWTYRRDIGYQGFAGALHAILYSLDPATGWYNVCDLPKVRSPWKVQGMIHRSADIGNLLEGVWLHCGEVKYRVRSVAGTAPRWAREYDGIGGINTSVASQVLEAIAVHPGDLVEHPIDVGVMLGTSKSGDIALDGDDLVPPTRERKSYSVPTSTSKYIYDRGLLR